MFPRAPFPDFSVIYASFVAIGLCVENHESSQVEIAVAHLLLFRRFGPQKYRM